MLFFLLLLVDARIRKGRKERKKMYECETKCLESSRAVLFFFLINNDRKSKKKKVVLQRINEMWLFFFFFVCVCCENELAFSCLYRIHSSRTRARLHGYGLPLQNE